MSELREKLLGIHRAIADDRCPPERLEKCPHNRMVELPHLCEDCYIECALTAVADAVEALPYKTVAEHLAPHYKGYLASFRNYERHEIIKMLRTQAEGKEER